MLNDIQITSDYMSIWVVLKRRVGAVTSQRITYRPSISIRVIVPYFHVMWEKGTITLVNIVPSISTRVIVPYSHFMWEKRTITLVGIVK
jgi:hypothetical protein